MAEFGREFGDIPDNEPGFYGRGQDRAVPAMVRAYADEAERLGADPRLVAQARAHAVRIELYQQEHGSKLPDL